MNGEYYHIVCTISDNEAKYYLNGELLGTYSHAITGIPNNTTYYLGATSSAQACSNQVLYSSRFYNKVLSQDEVTQNYTYEFTKLGLISGGDTNPEIDLQTIAKVDGFYNDGGVFSQWGNLKTTDYIKMPSTSGRIKHTDENATLGVTRVSYFDENKAYLGYNRGSGYGVASPGTGLIELDMDKGAKYFVVSSEDFSVLTYEYSDRNI